MTQLKKQVDFGGDNVRGGSCGWHVAVTFPASSSFRPSKRTLRRPSSWSLALDRPRNILINAQTRTTATKHTPTTHKNGSQALDPRKSMQAERKSLKAVVTRTNLGHDVPKPRLTNENIAENRVAHHDRRKRLACEAQASNIAFSPGPVRHRSARGSP